MHVSKNILPPWRGLRLRASLPRGWQPWTRAWGWVPWDRRSPSSGPCSPAQEHLIKDCFWQCFGSGFGFILASRIRISFMKRIWVAENQTKSWKIFTKNHKVIQGFFFHHWLSDLPEFTGESHIFFRGCYESVDLKYPENPVKWPKLINTQNW